MNSAEIKILSGGLGTDLCVNGPYDDAALNKDPLWSARIPFENPQAVKDVHRRFIEVGCNVVTTATYQASIQGYVKNLGVTAEKAEQIIRSCVDIACEAVQESNVNEKIIVGGSIGPYGAMLHDRSEYTGSYIDSTSIEHLKEHHRANMNILVSQGVDLLACETLPGTKEAIAIADLLREMPDTKAWISFTTKDGDKTSHGDCLRKAFEALAKYEQVIAVGMNCSDPWQVVPIANIAKECMAPHQRFIAYPNNDVPECKARAPWQCIDEIPSWLNTGVFSWIGGCCMVTPKHMGKIKSVVREWESKM